MQKVPDTEKVRGGKGYRAAPQRRSAAMHLSAAPSLSLAALLYVSSFFSFLHHDSFEKNYYENQQKHTIWSKFTFSKLYYFLFQFI